MINEIKQTLGINPTSESDYQSLLGNGAVILDVRSETEYSGGHIQGSINIPVDTLANSLHKLKDKNQPVITCCASGRRSEKAKDILVSNGYLNVYNGCGWQSLNQKISGKPITMEHFYNVNIQWEKDRKGMMCSPELSRDAGTCIEVATPPEFPKGMKGIWSPEHLFTAAVSSCLMTTFLAIAENSKLEFSAFTCQSKGKLAQVDGKMLMSEIILEPHIVIAHEEDRERAERVLKKSEAACLISNSVKSKVTMANINIESAQQAKVA